MTYPQAPAQGYPQQPYQPASPAPAPAYGQPPQPYAPQAVANPQQPYGQAAPQPAQHGTLDEFYGQPSMSGKAISYTGKQPGYQITGIVARTVTDADVMVQTNRATGQVQPWRDGKPKLVMVVPLQVVPSAEHPEGTAGWYVKGQARDELARAMEEAGVPPAGRGHMPPPEKGAQITITFMGVKPIPGMAAANIIQVHYLRPEQANGQLPAPAQPPAPQYAQPQPPAPAPGYADPAQQAQPAPQYAQPQPQFAPPPGHADPAQAYLTATGQPQQQYYAPQAAAAPVPQPQPQQAPPQYAQPQPPAGYAPQAPAQITEHQQSILDTLSQQGPAPQ